MGAMPPPPPPGRRKNDAERSEWSKTEAWFEAVHIAFGLLMLALVVFTFLFVAYMAGEWRGLMILGSVVCVFVLLVVEIRQRL